MKNKLVISFVLLLLAGIMIGCGADTPWEDGTYQATAEGYNDDIVLEVVISGGEITQINIIEHSETPGIADSAFDAIIPAIIESQSTDVDIVSGATLTCDAVIEAVDRALEEAEK